MFTMRRKYYSILKGPSTEPKRFQYARLQNSPSSCDPTTPRLLNDSACLILSPSPPPTLAIHGESADLPTDYPPKYRRIFGTWTVCTPNSSRFANHLHSRILIKFPFLVEMVYWAISFFFYRLTGVMAQILYGGTQGLWDIAQGHGIAILELETWFFGLNETICKDRWAEYRIQQWYLTGADGGDFRGLWLTILDRGYSLIHIPGTVGYVSSLRLHRLQN